MQDLIVSINCIDRHYFLDIGITVGSKSNDLRQER